jgi:hypothetical protein
MRLPTLSQTRPRQPEARCLRPRQPKQIRPSTRRPQHPFQPSSKMMTRAPKSKRAKVPSTKGLSFLVWGRGPGTHAKMNFQNQIPKSMMFGRDFQSQLISNAIREDIYPRIKFPKTCKASWPRIGKQIVMMNLLWSPRYYRRYHCGSRISWMPRLERLENSLGSH